MYSGPSNKGHRNVPVEGLLLTSLPPDKRENLTLIGADGGLFSGLRLLRRERSLGAGGRERWAGRTGSGRTAATDNGGEGEGNEGKALHSKTFRS